MDELFCEQMSDDAREDLTEDAKRESEKYKQAFMANLIAINSAIFNIAYTTMHDYLVETKAVPEEYGNENDFADATMRRVTAMKNGSDWRLYLNFMYNDLLFMIGYNHLNNAYVWIAKKTLENLMENFDAEFYKELGDVEPLETEAELTVEEFCNALYEGYRSAITDYNIAYYKAAHQSNMPIHSTLAASMPK